MTQTSNATIDTAIKIQAVIRKHLTEEDDCNHKLQQILEEVFPDENTS